MSNASRNYQISTWTWTLCFEEDQINNQQRLFHPKTRREDSHIHNCIPCIVSNRKRGKMEGELHPLPKKAEPLQTYHIDHLGPLESTSKQYKHIFAIIDSFTKFCRLYSTKLTTSSEVISKLKLQSSVFGNPSHIVSDRGTAFTFTDFDEYCKAENITHATITTGVPRSNGQIERLNSTIIAVSTNLSLQNSRYSRIKQKTRGTTIYDESLQENITLVIW